MNIKKVTKIISVLFIIATMALSVSMILFGTAFASGLQIPDVNSGTTPAALSNTTQNVLHITAYICYTAAVILLIMLGIKYMTSAPEAKAEVKKMAVIYVIGALLVFAAGAVLQVLSSTFNTAVVTGSTTTTTT